LIDAKAACDANVGCNGITKGGGSYTLRSTSVAQPSPYNETSWLVTKGTKEACHPLPRQRGINYSPGTMVRLIDLGPADEKEKYFYAANTTTTTGETITPIDATQFYAELLEHTQYYERVLEPAMVVQLPNTDTRQRDMVSGHSSAARAKSHTIHFFIQYNICI
jgi:hypothetical protein